MSEGTNATQPNPPLAGSPDVAAELQKVKEEKAELERAVKGIKADLLSEREKRQQLEAARQNPPSQAGSNPVADPVDNLLKQKVEQYGVAVAQHVIAYEKAKAFVAAKAGVDPDDVEQSDAWKEVVDYAQKRGIVGSTPDKTAKLAWTLLQQEKTADKASKDAAEADRLKALNANASVSTSTSAAPAGSAKTLTNKDIEKMPLSEYAKVRELIAKGEVKVIG